MSLAPIYFGVTQIGGLNTPTDTAPPAIGRAISEVKYSDYRWNLFNRSE